MQNKEKKIVHLALPMELYQQVKNLAEYDVRTVPNFIRQVLRQYIAHLEDENSWKI